LEIWRARSDQRRSRRLAGRRAAGGSTLIAHAAKLYLDDATGSVSAFQLPSLQPFGSTGGAGILLGAAGGLLIGQGVAGVAFLDLTAPGGLDEIGRCRTPGWRRFIAGNY